MRNRSPAKSADSSPPVPARDFEEDVAVVVRIFRQQHLLQFAAELFQALTRRANFLFGEFAHGDVRQQFLCGGGVVHGLAPQRVLLDDGPKLGVFARELAILIEVRGDVLAA